jgi:hypothetical protein
VSVAVQYGIASCQQPLIDRDRRVSVIVVMELDVDPYFV